MGGCVSTSNRSGWRSSRSFNGGTVSSSCLGIGISCGQNQKNYDKRTFSDHEITLKQLNSKPNRILSNGKSRTTCLFTQQGLKGINQDAMVVWEDFLPEDVTFCGVFDGHGPHGHLVARKVRDALPTKLLSFLRSSHSRGQTRLKGWPNRSEGRNAEDDISEGDSLSSFWSQAFLNSYKAMDKELRSVANLDCFCSGCTAVTMVKQGSNLFMGYIGDSRAVMGSMDGNSIVATQLTVDLKPDLPKEAERIKRCKGRVFAMQDEPEVSRVWLPFDDAPGLAMARAFGDFCLKEYGVISIPEVSHRTITDKDQFIVLASDGIWDVLSNEEVVEIISLAPTRSSAARILVNSAAREWKLKYPTSKMDDCAVVCFFLDGKMDSESDYEEHGLSSANLRGHFSSSMTVDGQKTEPCLQRDFTVRLLEGNGADEVEEGGADSLNAEDQNTSGFESVTRANSLVQLPRFSGNVTNYNGQKTEPYYLQKNSTVRSSEGDGTDEDDVGADTTTAEDQNWSGLEGITRVNSLVQLPRFPSG